MKGATVLVLFEVQHSGCRGSGLNAVHAPAPREENRESRDREHSLFFSTKPAADKPARQILIGQPF